MCITENYINSLYKKAESKGFISKKRLKGHYDDKNKNQTNERYFMKKH